MILRKDLPAEHRAWNRQWGAPFGSRLNRMAHRWPQLRSPIEGVLFQAAPRLRGKFAFQPNNSTREYEYPWVFDAVNPTDGMRILEIGGSLSGLQFVFDKSGAHVVNVDPGEAAHGRGWPVDDCSIARLNRMFGTKIELRNTFLSEAGLEDASFDRAVSVSTIEHIPEEEMAAVMADVARVLKPGGLFVATIDLFLNVHPFTTRATNEYGANISVANLIEPHGLELITGERSELFGYPEFSCDAVQSRLEDFALGTYPALIQAIVARKPIAS